MDESKHNCPRNITHVVFRGTRLRFPKFISSIPEIQPKPQVFQRLILIDRKTVATMLDDFVKTKYI